MTDVESLRQSILQESDVYGSKKRFGLFSHPISNAITDNGAYKKKVHPRDPATNKPITELRNFYTSPPKKGQLKLDYFGPINSLASSHIKDEFLEPGKRLLKQEKEKHNQGKKHQVSFFTGAGSKILDKPAYPYVTSKSLEKDPRRHRESDGRVKVQPRNFFTNSQSTVETKMFKPYKHLDDPYDRAHQLQLERERKNKSLLPQSSFKPNSFSPQLFNSEKKVREEDQQIKKKQLKKSVPHNLKHESPWKSSNPNKSGVYGFFQSFPKYMESPPNELKRKQPQQKLRDPMRLMNPELSTPTCSISTHKMNLGQI